ncbi:MAG: YkgJ family cysteine cluster protein [Desulfobacterales bacterium]|nr:YkgJ family cysteine cluster protein [Desulfobacterales bacterium]
MKNNETEKRDHCIRCGECCLSSSPTLQMADVSLVYDGLIEKSNIYAIRVGELVRDNVKGEMKVTDKEILKIREKENGRGCIYYDEEEKGCTMYEHRPIQCRALACWDESEFMRVYARPKLSRRDVINDRNLLRLMAEHDKKCSYMELEKCVGQIEKEGEKAVKSILELLKFDYKIRLLIAERLNVVSAEMDFILGRPLTETINMFGLKVIREQDGSFFLTTVE